MAAKKSTSVLISKLKDRFYVREGHKQSHVDFLAALYRSGTALPPIEVTPDFAVIDGRHRVLALKLLKRRHVEVIIINETNNFKLVARAIKANIGGSLPPTPDDIFFAIEHLVKNGATKNEVFATIPLDASFVAPLYKGVMLQHEQKKLQRAVEAVADGNTTIVQAAKKFGLNAKNIQAAVRGRAKKVERHEPAQLKRAVDMRFKRFRATLVQSTRHLMTNVRTGNISPKTAEGVVDYTQSSLDRLIVTWEAQRKRFESIKKAEEKK